MAKYIEAKKLRKELNDKVSKYFFVNELNDHQIKSILDILGESESPSSSQPE